MHICDFILNILVKRKNEIPCSLYSMMYDTWQVFVLLTKVRNVNCGAFLSFALLYGQILEYTSCSISCDYISQIRADVSHLQC